MGTAGPEFLPESNPAAPFARGRLRIGTWLVDPALDEIRSLDAVIKLEPRSMRLLLYLAAHPGEVVRLDDLLAAVWPNVVVTPQSVYNTVAQLRRTLGDSAETPAYIATVSRKGYRLIAPVTTEPAREVPAEPDGMAPNAPHSGSGIPAPAAAPVAEPPPAAARVRKFRRPTLVAGLVVGLTIGALAYVGTSRLRAPLASAIQDATVTGAEPSIAVLPLQDFSEGHDQEYLSDGLAEELTHLLSQVSGLRVASRTSAFAFRGRGDDVTAITARLHVSHVLEGSIRKSADRLRITVQLIRTDTGFHVWSKTYDRDRAELFALEDDIAAEVVRALSGTLLVAHVGRPAPKPDAYNLLLEGRYYGRKGTEADRARSVALYENAVAVDPDYALAWAWLAQGYGVQAAAGWVPPAAGYDRAKRAARRAIELDPNLADGHATLGYVFESWDWNWAEAGAEYRRALALDPTSVRVLNLNGHYAMTQGRVADAEAFFRRAMTQDPMSPGARIGIIVALRCQGRLAEAEAMTREALAITPASLHAALGVILVDRGQAEAGLAEILQDSEERWRLSDLPIAYDALGRHADADRALAELERKYPQFAYRIAVAYANRGQADAAFGWLEKARQAKDFDLTWLKIDPGLRRLHGDPRFAALVRALALPG